MKKMTTENMKRINGGRDTLNVKLKKSPTNKNSSYSGGYMSRVCEHTLLEFGRAIGAYK